MNSTGIKNNIVNEIARKFETIARSYSSDSSNSSSGLNHLNKNKRHSNDNLDCINNEKKQPNNTISFHQVKKMQAFTIKPTDIDLQNQNDKIEMDNEEIKFSIETNDTNKQSTVKRKNGLELFQIKSGNSLSDENTELKQEIKLLREQLDLVTNDLLHFKKKYQEFQLDMETNEKYRTQQMDKLKRNVDFLLKLSLTNSLSTGFDEDQEISEHIIKF